MSDTDEIRALADARRAAGMSQAELADRLGTSSAYVSQLENGYRVPSLDTLRAWAEVLGGRLRIDFDHEHQAA